MAPCGGPHHPSCTYLLRERMCKMIKTLRTFLLLLLLGTWEAAGVGHSQTPSPGSMPSRQEVLDLLSKVELRVTDLSKALSNTPNLTPEDQDRATQSIHSIEEGLRDFRASRPNRPPYLPGANLVYIERSANLFITVAQTVWMEGMLQPHPDPNLELIRSTFQLADTLADLSLITMRLVGNEEKGATFE